MKVVMNLFNKKFDKESFTRVVKYFSVVAAFPFYCDAKHSDISRKSSLVYYFLLYLSYIMSQLLLSRTNLIKCTKSVLMYICNHIICTGLSVLFLYIPAHKASIFEKLFLS